MRGARVGYGRQPCRSRSRRGYKRGRSARSLKKIISTSDNVILSTFTGITNSNFRLNSNGWNIITGTPHPEYLENGEMRSIDGNPLQITASTSELKGNTVYCLEVLTLLTSGAIGVSFSDSVFLNNGSHAATKATVSSFQTFRTGPDGLKNITLSLIGDQTLSYSNIISGACDEGKNRSNTGDRDENKVT